MFVYILLRFFSVFVFADVFFFAFVIYCAHFEAVLDIFFLAFFSFCFVKINLFGFLRKCSYFVFILV